MNNHLKEHLKSHLHAIRSVLTEEQLKEANEHLKQIYIVAKEATRPIVNITNPNGTPRNGELMQQVTELKEKTAHQSNLLTQLGRDKVKAEAELQRRITELEEDAKSQACLSAVEDHTQIKVKCMECSLHFTVFTWTPKNHNCRTLHCPECGQHNGHFIIWHEPGRGFICQNVPGKAQIVQMQPRLTRANCQLPPHKREPS